MKNKALWITLIVAMMALLLWLAFFWQPELRTTRSNKTPHIQLSQTNSASGGDFILQGPSGAASLSDYRGKVVLLYFGYTFCPDVCPTSLSLMAQALTMLTPEELNKVNAFFVSVDPERDTLDVLKVYTPFFHPAIAGLGGTVEQVAQVASQYGARYMKQKAKDGAPYSVDHSSFTYLIGPDGKLAASLPHGSSPQQIVDMIRPLLKAKATP
jgi:protein SCO1/2